MEFLEQQSYYVVLIITLIIWAGIFGYLVSIDKKIGKLEKNKRE